VKPLVYASARALRQAEELGVPVLENRIVEAVRLGRGAPRRGADPGAASVGVARGGGGVSGHGSDCGCVRCVGFGAGNEVALRHGATSERRVRPLAQTHRRRVLRQLRLRSSDVDPIGRGYLDAYARLVAKLDLIDRYVAEHGLLRADGEPQPALRLYVTLVNSARLALARLEEHVRAGGDVGALAALAERYGDGS
jgi:hypothetical protein